MGLKWVFYFESVLMSITVVLCLFAPATFLGQFTENPPTDTFTLNLARWYGVPFIALTYVQLDALFSGKRKFIQSIMISYMIVDLVQFTATVMFAMELGNWSSTFLVSAITAIIFAVTRLASIIKPELLGVYLRD